jgi:hypothetical protein
VTGGVRAKRIVVLAFVAAVLLGFGADAQGQCSMCRSLLATPEGQRMAAALREGIWILLAAPFAVFGVIALAAVRSRKRLDTLE